jgi:transcriptional regulator with GAF, ATPase, and Fis domain
LRFEQLLLDVSNRLIVARLSELQSEIRGVLSQAGVFWAFDRLLLYELPPDQQEFILAHSYVRHGLGEVPPPRESGFLDWGLSRALIGDVAEMKAFIETRRSVGPDSDARRSACAGSGDAGSGVVIPLRVEGTLRGCIAALQDGEWQEPPPRLLKALTDLGEMLSGALQRFRTGIHIRDHLQFEVLLSDISATYINIAPDEVNHVIKGDLGRLARFFGTDRCALYIFDKEHNDFRTDHVWGPEEDDGFFEDLREWFKGQPSIRDHFHYYFDKWIKGEHQEVASLDTLPPEAGKMKMFYERFGVKSALSIPFQLGGRPAGALVIADTRKHHRWARELIPRLRLCGEVFGNALARKQSEEALNKAFSEIELLKNRFESDYQYLREEIAVERSLDGVVGESRALKQILAKVRQVAPTNATVLLMGETGTGKGVIARTIHRLSTRRHRPLIQVNCAALSAHLIESELFGHEKGAFTGAITKRPGRFELAHGTTLFLDEIGDLPLGVQGKLLRVSQDGEFERVGGTTTLTSDARIIAATNKDLEKEVEAGRFRKDLWYRLSVFPILIPPLRERIEDVPSLATWIIRKYGRALGKKFDTVSLNDLKALQQYRWPGNVRELENVLERAVITSREGRLRIEAPGGNGRSEGDGHNLQHVERNHILHVLDTVGWTIEGPEGAARRLGLNPSTLRSRMRKLHIRRPANKTASF